MHNLLIILYKKIKSNNNMHQVIANNNLKIDNKLKNNKVKRSKKNP